MCICIMVDARHRSDVLLRPQTQLEPTANIQHLIGIVKYFNNFLLYISRKHPHPE